MNEKGNPAGAGGGSGNKCSDGNDEQPEYTKPTIQSQAIAPTSARQRLPDRRASETISIQVAGRRYKCSVSYFADGRLGEIFLSNNKAGSDSDCAARDSAVVASIALQYGVPLDVIRKALMRDSRGNPNGPLGVALDSIATRIGSSS